LRVFITSKEFSDKARNSEPDFSRKRKLPLVALIILLMNLVKTNSQTAINKFILLFNINLVTVKSISQQTFSKARQKLKWIACRLLFKKLVQFIYSFNYKTWHNFRIFPIDGAKIQLPSVKGFKEKFGGLGFYRTAPTAQGAILYDVLNEIVVDAQLVKYKNRGKSIGTFTSSCIKKNDII
jgi:hypothetical protein